VYHVNDGQDITNANADSKQKLFGLRDFIVPYLRDAEVFSYYGIRSIYSIVRLSALVSFSWGCLACFSAHVLDLRRGSSMGESQKISNFWIRIILVKESSRVAILSATM
jgi:hypothetical protein